MTPAIRAKLAALGNDLSPEMLQGSIGLMAGMNRGLAPDTQIQRDIAYGPDPRHRLDLFWQGDPSGAPVFVFVHGGGFLMGDKHTEGSPFYSNMGDFAARHGMIGIAMTYRLAPEHRFPSGPDDMALAVDWLRANVAEHGGDPAKIVLSGQSAGAVHVAGYLAHRADHASGIAGGALMSGIYDTHTCAPNASAEAYYGSDRRQWGMASCMPGLLATQVPVQFSVAEFDPDDFQQQAAQLVEQWYAARGRYPEMHYLAGHNHLSPGLSVGSDQTEVERMLAGFVARAAG